jgi:hypothetical protein
MTEEKIDEECVARFAHAYDLLFEKLLRAKSFDSAKLLLSGVLDTAKYFELPAQEPSEEEAVRSALIELENAVQTTLSGLEKNTLDERIRLIIEKRLRLVKRAERRYRGDSIKLRLLMERLPGQRDVECSYFIDALEHFLGTAGSRYLPCEVYLFGPFARERVPMDSYVNIAIVSDGFRDMGMDERKRTLRSLTAGPDSRLITIGITHEEVDARKYPLGVTKLLFVCTRQPGLAQNWELL